MGFDFVTFCAQIINLFLLIWILKRFLYRPILETIDKRRQHITHTIEEADNKLASAAQMESNLTQQKTDFEQQRQKRFDELERDMLQQKAQMMKELELNYLAKRDKMQEDLDRSWASAENTIQSMMANEFMVLAQKVLCEWSEQNTMDQALKLFDKKLSKLPHTKTEKIQKLLAEQKSVQVFSSETLNRQQQEAIRGILARSLALPQKVRLHFKKRPSLLL